MFARHLIYAAFMISTVSAAAFSFALPLDMAQAQCRLCNPNAGGANGNGNGNGNGVGPVKPAPRPLEIDIYTNIHYGRAAIGVNGQGQISIEPDGTRTISGALEDLGGAYVSGRVEISGEPNKKVRIDLPMRVTLTSLEGMDATVQNLRSDAKNNPKLDVGGRLVVYFGGDLIIPPGHAGQFRGRIPITVEYD